MILGVQFTPSVHVLPLDGSRVVGENAFRFRLPMCGHGTIGINVPSFLHARGLQMECPGLDPVTVAVAVAVAYGGNFYAIVEPHPERPEIAGLSHVL